MKMKFKSGYAIFVGCIVLGVSEGAGPDRPNPTSPLGPSSSVLGVYSKAAVATNGVPCAKIGKDILRKKGNAVEAAIAALFCEGVTCLQSMGIGGGFLMTIYERATGKATVLNARETAPAAAHRDMFQGDAHAAHTGGKAVAIPGEIKGYSEAYKRFRSGNVSWKELVQPTINLCRNGFVVNEYLAEALKSREKEIHKTPSLSEILIDPKTNTTWSEGSVMTRPKLADTLEVIAQEGGDALYTGSLVDDFVKDIQDLQGIITKKDMQDYRVDWVEPIVGTLGDGLKMYSVPPPGSGVLLSFMLEVLEDFIPTAHDTLTYHHIAETFKYGYGQRTELGDPRFVDVEKEIKNLMSEGYAAKIRAQIRDDRTFQDPAHYGAVLAQPQDHGTSHLSVVAPNGDAVAVTSTINQLLGAKVRSKSTGIILNDQMDDFSSPNITNEFGVPPSPANFIQPGKRPMSSMTPTIFVDKNGDVRLVVGAAGGTKITSAVTLVSAYNLWGGINIKRAVDEHRIHHQLLPMVLQYEYGMLEHTVQGLEKLGHKTKMYSSDSMKRPSWSESAVTAIAVEKGKVFASYDFRRSGLTAGF